MATRFLDSHAEVEIELLLSDRNIELIEEGIDVALRIGALADSTLSAQLVGQVRRLWVASRPISSAAACRRRGRSGAS